MEERKTKKDERGKEKRAELPKTRPDTDSQKVQGGADRGETIFLIEKKDEAIILTNTSENEEK